MDTPVKTSEMGPGELFLEIAHRNAAINARDDAMKPVFSQIEQALREVGANQYVSVRLDVQRPSAGESSENYLEYRDVDGQWCMRIRQTSGTVGAVSQDTLKAVPSAPQYLRIAAAQHMHALVQAMKEATVAADQSCENAFNSFMAVAADISHASRELPVKKPVVSVTLGRDPAAKTGRA
jgi:hypothetical protein